MIEIRCEIVEAGLQKDTAVVYGYIDPAPLIPRPEGNLTALLHEIRENKMSLGNAHEPNRLHEHRLPSRDALRKPTKTIPPAAQVNPVYLLVSDDTGHQVSIKVETFHRCQFGSGEVMYEIVLPGDAKKWGWLVGRLAILVAGSQCPERI